MDDDTEDDVEEAVGITTAVLGAAQAAVGVGTAAAQGNAAGAATAGVAGGLGAATQIAGAAGATGTAADVTAGVAGGVGAATALAGAAAAPDAAAGGAMQAAGGALQGAGGAIQGASAGLGAVVQAAGALAQVADVVQSLMDVGEPIPPVRSAFICDQSDAQWLIKRLGLNECLGQPYDLQVDVHTQELDTDTSGFLGASCSVDLERGDHRRTVHGIVREVEWVRIAAERLHVRLQIVPALTLLGQRVDSRIFQDKSVPEILEEVFEALTDYDREVRLELDGTYEPRDYCVQYQESDLDFGLRLMQEEGITFFFDHSGEESVEVLVLTDSNEAFVDAPLHGEAAAIPVVASVPDEAHTESVQEFVWRLRLRPNAVMRSDFDQEEPGEVLEYPAPEECEDPALREVYEHGNRRFTGDDGEALALRRFEAHSLLGRTAFARANAIGLSAGTVFELEGHGLPDCDQRYLIIAVRHVGEGQDETTEAVERRFWCELECIPAEVPYRPPMTIRRPRVSGDQTAFVVGPEGEEIHTDEQGRIKVHFHWDRLNPLTDVASCWVRVAQAWASGAWGSFCLPRVGMEVVVAFLDGNPDRPLVTGCVYNGDTDLPYTMPDDKTKTTFKSNSSPGGEGFNELRIEDAAGSEEVFVHAQKDLNVTALNDHSLNVGAARSVSVGADNSVSITGNHTMTISGEGEGDFNGGKVDVTGDYALSTTKTVSVTAPDKISLTVQGSSITIEPNKITLVAGDGAQVVLDANALVQSNDESKLLLDTHALLRAKAGAWSLYTHEAQVRAKDNAGVLFNADVNMEAAAGGFVLLTQNATVSGEETLCQGSAATLTLNADAALAGGTVTCGVDGGGSVELTSSGATLAGAAVGVQADAALTMTGNPINIG